MIDLTIIKFLPRQSQISVCNEVVTKLIIGESWFNMQNTIFDFHVVAILHVYDKFIILK